MKEDISSEEKLLRLIRGKNKPEIEQSPANSVPQKNAPTVNKRKKNLKIDLNSYLSFGNAEKILRIALGLSVVYLVISLAFPLLGPQKISLPKVQPRKTPWVNESVNQEAEPLEHYEKGISGKQIFGIIGTSGGANSAAINTDLLKDINLVGIIADKNPQAIIEDKKTKKTSYVSKGQMVGDFLIDDIQEGKIILNYRSQKYELYL